MDGSFPGDPISIWKKKHRSHQTWIAAKKAWAQLVGSARRNLIFWSCWMKKRAADPILDLKMCWKNGTAYFFGSNKLGKGAFPIDHRPGVLDVVSSSPSATDSLHVSSVSASDWPIISVCPWPKNVQMMMSVQKFSQGMVRLECVSLLTYFRLIYLSIA